MAYGLGEIGSAIFSGKEMYLDLDTGHVLSCWLVEHALTARPEHCVKLPFHSANFLPHCYIHTLLNSDSAAREFMRNSYPALEKLQNSYPHCDERVYEMLSNEFCKAYSRIILHARDHSSDESTAKLPTYKEFYCLVCKRAAYEWCKKNGLELSKLSNH